MAGFRVPVEVRSDPDPGVYATTDIEIGALVWSCVPGANAHVLQTPQAARDFITAASSGDRQRLWDQSYVSDGTLRVHLDDAQYVRHSSVPTTTAGGKEVFSLFALRKIVAGEEITRDFGMFPRPDWWKHIAHVRHSDCQALFR